MRTRILLIIVAAILLAPVVGVAVLFYTQAGLQLVAGQLWRLERYNVRIEGLSGTLSGPLRIARFELNHPRVHAVANDIVIDPQLRGLFIQTLQAGSVTVGSSVVELHQVDMPPNDKPPRFLPTFLRVDARNVELANVRYVHLNGTVVDARTVRGRVTVTSSRLRAHHFAVDSDLFDASGNLLLRAAATAVLPMGLEGDVSGRLHLPDVDLVLKATAEGTIDELNMQGELLEPNAASARAVLTRPQNSWNIAGKVTSRQFLLDPWLPDPPLSLHDIALDVELNPDGMHAKGMIGIPEIDEQALIVDATGRYAERTLFLSNADLRLQNSPAALQASGKLIFDGSAPTLDLIARWQSMQWPLRGNPIVTSSNGDGSLRGPLPYDFAVTASLAGRNFPAAAGSATGVLSKEQVTLASYSVNALGGSLSGNGQLQFAQPRAWRITTRATNVNPAGLFKDFPGNINLAANASGEGFDEEAIFSADVSELRGTLRGEPIQGRGFVQRDRRGWTVRGANLGVADARLTLDGIWQQSIEANWSLNVPSLDRLLPEASGKIVSTGRASGPLKSLHVTGELDAQQIRYQQWQAGQITIKGDVDASGQSPSRLLASASRVGAGEPLIASMQVSGEGTALEHRINMTVTGAAATPRDTPPSAEMQIAGSYDQKIWNATVTTTKLVTGEADDKLSIAEPAQIMASSDRAQLENFCLIAGAGRICASGEWQRDGAWQGTVSGYEIPLALLLPPAGQEAEYGGRIEGRVHAFGSPKQPWQGEAGMRIIDAAIIYRPQGAEPETLNLGTGGLAATAKPDGIDFSFGVQAFTDTFLFANAHLDRSAGTDLLHLPLTGDMRARAADANILPLLFSEVDHAAGLLTANATIGGTLAEPEINGRAELSNGELDSYRVNLALRALNLVADLASNGLDFRGTGRAGEGELQTEGRFSWHEGKSRGELHLRGANLLVADLPDYRVVASPDLRFAIDANSVNVSGEVLIPSARVQPNQITGAVRASDDARYVHETEAERAGRMTVHSEVKVTIGDDVRVDAFGLQGRLGGAVGTTVHTGEIAIGRGELNVIDGRYEAYGQKLEINKGQLLFEASPLDDPGLDIEARRKIETVTVGLNVRGTLQEPRLSFFSDPTMPQTQIVTYLLTGKAPDSMSGTDTATMASARDTLTVQGGGLLASQIGRRLGLEEVGVESSMDRDGSANTALVLGKFLSPRLFISYGISLTESINTLKLRYTISDKWVFKTEAGENQSADLEYTIEH
ncbi:MAG: translocation/assembly module TamB domain-containing protein [Pseudomonadota bacterium]|nr:translocation/assembly module TamB domain-containing protein [Pseudomonadota bacterium]